MPCSNVKCFTKSANVALLGCLKFAKEFYYRGLWKLWKLQLRGNIKTITKKQLASSLMYGVEILTLGFKICFIKYQNLI